MSTDEKDTAQQADDTEGFARPTRQHDEPTPIEEGGDDVSGQMMKKMRSGEDDESGASGEGVQSKRF